MRNVREGRARRAASTRRWPGRPVRASADGCRAQLSGGQQQRVALARAIVFDPRLLLLDEPFGALDRKLREQMQLEVRRLQRRLGLTTLFVTHDQEEALVLSDRIAVMEQGRIVQLGAPQEIYGRPATRFVAGFIGESNLFRVKVDERGSGSLENGTRIPLPGNAVAAGREVGVLLRPERPRQVGGTEAADVTLLGRSGRDGLSRRNRQIPRPARSRPRGCRALAIPRRRRGSQGWRPRRAGLEPRRRSPGSLVVNRMTARRRRSWKAVSSGAGTARPSCCSRSIAGDHLPAGPLYRPDGASSAPRASKGHARALRKGAERRALRPGALDTLEIAAASRSSACCSAIPLAYFLATTRAPWPTIGFIFVLLPFWTSVLVRTYGWMVLLGRNGIFNRALIELGLIDDAAAAAEQHHRRADRHGRMCCCPTWCCRSTP